LTVPAAVEILASVLRRLANVVANASLVAAVASAQCADPPRPPAGFAVASAIDQLVTYSDAYRTRADVRWPTTAPGPCGWPLVVLVHGWPANKNGPVATMAAEYAARGYVTVAYDVRGQGSGIALNPGRGTTLMAFAEWIDLFEIMEWVEQQQPALVDFNRIGVTGISQGGAHSWAAAAWSGRTPPANPRRSAPFPVVRAVAPTVMVPSHTDAATFDGTAFVDSWAGFAYAPPNANFVLDANFQATMRSYVLADDPAGMRAWMRADPGRDFQALLATSTTATLATMAWHDESMPAEPALRALASMPATTPKRALLTTGNHGTPTNAYESARVDEIRRAWFDRFLKGAFEPVELGPPVLSAVIPPTAAEYLTGSTLWRHRADASFPPANATPAVWHLRQGGQLAAAAPTTNEPAELVQHTMPAGYDLQAWRADGAGTNVTQALARLPLSSFSYTTPPFAQAEEIAGVPTLRLELTPQQARFLLAARLEIVPTSGNPQVVAQGGRGAFLAGGPTPTTLTIELSATDCVVPAGARLRLSVRNHFLVKAAAVESFRCMPPFVPSTTAIEHRPGMASRLELPMRPFVGLDAATATTSLDLAQPAPASFTLRSSPAFAGSSYWLLGSLLGQGPATPLPGGDTLWLWSDALTSSLLGAAGNPLFAGFVGALDANGSAQATLDLLPVAPLPAFLSGWRVHFAPVLVQGNAALAGPPLEIVLR
jgi:predicted acyl esterase